MAARKKEVASLTGKLTKTGKSVDTMGQRLIGFKA